MQSGAHEPGGGEGVPNYIPELIVKTVLKSLLLVYLVRNPPWCGL